MFVSLVFKVNDQILLDKQDIILILECNLILFLVILVDLFVVD